MKLVIEIPENTYRQIQALARSGYFEHDICGNSMRRIANGTPLPKGHGRLVDVDKIPIDCDYYDVENAPTIIEAESEESE